MFIAKRYASDLVIQRNTGRVIVKSGSGGRTSVSGHVATVFGCTGFLGRYIVNKLAKQGTQVVTPFRGEEDLKRHLKLSGDLGQIVSQELDIRNYNQVLECVRHSDIVYNLIGRDYETKNFSYHQVHVDAAASIARACREAGVSRLVHISAFNADEKSPSVFLQTKAIGEKVVKENFPDATIVRPSTMFGHEDKLLNDIGSARILPVARHGQQILTPVAALDVALALQVMLDNHETMGKVYELVGPKSYTYQQIVNMSSAIIKEQIISVNVPKPILLAAAKALGLLPFPYISPDEVERLYIDEIPNNNSNSFKQLGIQPQDLGSALLHYLRKYRDYRYFEEGLDDFRQKNVPLGDPVTHKF